jgi:hypothetical protein
MKFSENFKKIKYYRVQEVQKIQEVQEVEFFLVKIAQPVPLSTGSIGARHPWTIWLSFYSY